MNFKPKEAVKGLLGGLPERSQDIISKRYGLDSAESLTLEAIGQTYGITRERVRQIEEATLKLIKKSETFGRLAGALEELKLALEDYGGVAHESHFLRHLHDHPVTQNQINFFLVLGDDFLKLKEDDNFHHRWTTNKELADRVHTSLEKLIKEMSTDELLSEEEIVSRLLKKFSADHNDPLLRERGKRWLLLSKRLGANPIGEWGLAHSPNIKLRGIRDYAFLVLRRHGSPLHFTEVAKAIENSFKHQANPATCHNELIKDGRFVLVGRGLYALSDWGYTRGVVRDVIRAMIEKHGPLSEQEILDHVLKERYVKENTVLVNLRNPKHFKKNSAGKYATM